MLYDMKQKRKKWQDNVYINGENQDVENKTKILYNDTVNQLKGM
jgi:hypothetical protein